MNILKYRTQGRRAYLACKAQWSNPHKEGTEAHVDWDQGYEDAKYEDYGRWKKIMIDFYYVVRNQFCECRVIRYNEIIHSHECKVFKGTKAECDMFLSEGYI